MLHRLRKQKNKNIKWPWPLILDLGLLDHILFWGMFARIVMTYIWWQKRNKKKYEGDLQIEKKIL